MVKNENVGEITRQIQQKKTIVYERIRDICIKNTLTKFQVNRVYICGDKHIYVIKFGRVSPIAIPPVIQDKVQNEHK